MRIPVEWPNVLEKQEEVIGKLNRKLESNITLVTERQGEVVEMRIFIQSEGIKITQ